METTNFVTIVQYNSNIEILVLFDKRYFQRSEKQATCFKICLSRKKRRPQTVRGRRLFSFFGKGRKLLQCLPKG